ncbi:MULTISPECIES: aromatase/cyclase [Streptomyces]|uniref:Cyclase n=1 Tax=Streptomyces xinghaiensis TaxID=1038928 RepID=A0A3M8F814_9ACTN|nr:MULTISPECIES: aromatase/cyclase [Streptomyces]PQM22811.1 cyclase [Streptomyces xinghaiensis]RKM97981.1 cyclase [Streptomyces xinghaiensis]RNC73881.1 cyclase [Streptomyces xinghaiensis]
MAPNATTATTATTTRTTPAAGGDAAHRTEHTVTVDAAPAAVFALIADVSGWPQVFGPTVHAEAEEEPDGRQTLRIWALAGDRVRHWTSRRILDASARTVSFRQVVSAHPVAAMGGEWRVEPVDGGGSRVVLLHDYRAVDDDPAAVELIGEAVDRNSRAELAALRNAAELGAARDELALTFEDSVDIAGRAEDVYAFLDRADRWPERLPHVARLELTEDEPGIQRMDMDTRSPDGSVHNTTSARVCFPGRHVLVYKQLRVPVAMSVHTGRWEIVPHGDGVRATSRHSVVLDPEGVRHALGQQATYAEARALVRRALGTNSTTTLRHAKEFAEAVRART